MTSEAFVWVYLPEHAEPVVCGASVRPRRCCVLLHLRSQLSGPRGLDGSRSRRDAARRDSLHRPSAGRAARPDQRCRPGRLGTPRHEVSPRRRPLDALDAPDLLLNGDGDRIGALAFSTSATECRTEEPPIVTLADMEAAMRGIQEGKSLAPELLAASLHGTSIGEAAHDEARQSRRVRRVQGPGDADLLRALNSVHCCQM